MMIFGIDETYRGNVIGSLFLICVGCSESFKFKNILKDSKKYSKNLLIKEYKNIKKDYYNNDITIFIKKITPKEIDKENINKLEMNQVKIIINEINNKYPNEEIIIYIDKFSNDLDKLETPNNIKIVAEYKADDKYQIVSCASIIAKYKGLQHIKSIKDKIIKINKSLLINNDDNDDLIKTINLFSGYCDKNTKKYISSNYFIKNTDQFYYFREKYKLKGIINNK